MTLSPGLRPRLGPVPTHSPFSSMNLDPTEASRSTATVLNPGPAGILTLTLAAALV